MSGLKDYSTTAASNATVGSVNWAEGQNPNTVNDSARQLMADIRTDRDNIEWRDWGHTPVYSDANTFTVASSSDLSSVYTVGRRIRATDATTLYGTITASSYAASTQTVDVVLDSGSLSASLTNISLGFDPTNYPIRLMRPVYGARAYRSTAANVIDTDDYDIYFNTELYDTASCLSQVTPSGENATLITVPADALWMNIDAVIIFASNATGRRDVALYSTNSTGTTEVALVPPLINSVEAFGSGRDSYVQLSTGWIQVTGGTYYKIATYQSSGGVLDIINSWLAVEFK